MRRLLLTTASVIALGLGGIGFASAHGTVNKQSGTSSPPTTASSTQSMNSRTAAMTHARRTGTRMSRTEIIQIQRKLRADNLYRGKLDGKFGEKTRIALRRFQQQNKLPATARLDRQTTSQLLGGTTMGQGTSMAPKRTHIRKLGQGTSMAPKRSKTNAGQGSSMPPNGSQPPKQSEQNQNNNLGSGSSSPPIKPDQNSGTNTSTNPKY